MTHELSQEFFFDAAHTLERSVEAEPSRRIHGHTYHAQVTVGGNPDPVTGMVLDLGRFREALQEVRQQLDHRMLNEVPGLGVPTLETLCSFILRQVSARVPGVCCVTVSRRASGETCSLRP